MLMRPQRDIYVGPQSGLRHLSAARSLDCKQTSRRSAVILPRALADIVTTGSHNLGVDRITVF